MEIHGVYLPRLDTGVMIFIYVCSRNSYFKGNTKQESQNINVTDKPAVNPFIWEVKKEFVKFLKKILQIVGNRCDRLYVAAYHTSFSLG